MIKLYELGADTAEAVQIKLNTLGQVNARASVSYEIAGATTTMCASFTSQQKKKSYLALSVQLLSLKFSRRTKLFRR